MNKLILIAALAASACGDNGKAQSTGEYVVDMCGPAPLAPGVAAQLDGNVVTITRDTYLRLQQFREDVAVWRDCVTDLP